MSHTLQNQEHLEAAQNEANIKREKFKESLSEEDKKKMEAVEQAVKILTDAKIFFHLFPYLTSDNPEFENRPGCWYWHSMEKFAEYDVSGKMTEDSKKLINDVGDSLVSVIFTLWFKKDIASLERLGNDIISCWHRDNNRLMGISEDKG